MKIIALTRGYESLVDEQDYDFLAKWRWRAMPTKSGHVYAGSGSFGLMHRVIMYAPYHLQVDHIDGNGLNNQRSNLRLATGEQNLWNAKKRANCKSQYKGVHPHGIGWKVECRGKYFGTFVDELEAARAYNEAAKQMMGDFARLNIIPGPEPLKIPANSHKRPADNGYEVLGYGRVLFWFPDEFEADKFINKYLKPQHFPASCPE